MHKILLLPFLSLYLASPAISQTDSPDYVKESEGPFYLLVETGAMPIDTIKNHLLQLGREQDGRSIRVSPLAIRDVNYGEVTILVVRRFQNPSAAQAFVEMMKKEETLAALTILLISQNNYRKFLKKQDLEEYKGFIRS